MCLFYHIQRNYGKDAFVEQDRGFLSGLTAFSPHDSGNAVRGAEGTLRLSQVSAKASPLLSEWFPHPGSFLRLVWCPDNKDPSVCVCWWAWGYPELWPPTGHSQWPSIVTCSHHLRPNKHITFFEVDVEQPWHLCKICGTSSWLQMYIIPSMANSFTVKPTLMVFIA